MDYVSVIHVCLTTLWKSVIGWEFKKYKKSRLSYFYHWLYLCLLYQWNFLYWQLKEKKRKKLSDRLRGPSQGPTATGSRVWFLVGVQNVRFWYKDFLEELWLGIFSLLFFILHISICFPFSFIRFLSRKEGRGVFLLAYKYVMPFVFTKSLYNSGKFHLVKYCAVTIIKTIRRFRSI